MANRLRKIISNIKLQFFVSVILIAFTFYYFVFYFPQSSIFILGDSSVSGAEVYLDNKLKGHIVKDEDKNIFFAKGISKFDSINTPNFPDDSIRIPVGVRKIEIKVISNNGDVYVYTAMHEEDVSYNGYKIKDFKKLNEN